MGQDQARPEECDQAQLHQTAFEWTPKPDLILTHSLICITITCEHLLVPGCCRDGASSSEALPWSFIHFMALKPSHTPSLPTALSPLLYWLRVEPQR